MELPSLKSTDIVVFAVTFFVSRWCLRRLKNREPAHRWRSPSSFPALPFVGSLPFLGRGGDQLYEYFLRKTGELGNVYTFYGGKRLALVVNGREAIVDALVNHAGDFADRCPLWTEENCLNTQLRGIIFKHYNESLKKFRKLTSSILREMSFGENCMTESRIQQMVEVLRKELQKRDGTPFDPKDLLTEFAGRFILSILFGQRFLQSESSRVRQILESSAKYLANIDPVIDMLPWLRFLPVFRRKISAMADAKTTLLKCLEEELDSSLKSKNAEETFVSRFAKFEGGSEENPIKSQPQLNPVEAETEEDRQELIHILRDLIFGGTETVSTTLLWALVLLANNPRIQDRLREEIDAVVPADQLPSLKDKDSLPYAEAVLLEVLRRKGVAPFSSTRATMKETEVFGFRVPAGCMVLVNLYSAHMDPKDWTDPKAFRPERFLDEQNKIILKDRVILFSLGHRSCIGAELAHQEIFLFLCSLIQRFTVRPPEGQGSISEQEKYGVVMAPTPFEICLVPRSR